MEENVESLERQALTRRALIRGASAVGLAALLDRFAPAYAWAQAGHGGHTMPTGGATTQSTRKVVDLSIGAHDFMVNGKHGHALMINGSIPGPLLRFKEGDEAVIRVTNSLKEDTSIHWHGILLPNPMDGVPGVTFAGIKPGETFEYRIPIKQYGTYWYHSHSAGQEQQGVYGPMILDPAGPDPSAADREYVVMLSDWTFMHPHEIVKKLKQNAGYFNYQRVTGAKAFSPEILGMWSRMRMDPSDILDVTGALYTYLMNGRTSQSNWTGIFKPGEKVRLRFINGSAMTIFDVRIPGLKMTVVQADGQTVHPVEVEEFRFAAGETYDVIVQPTEDMAYTVYAEAMDRSDYVRGTLAPREGMSGAIPPKRERPLRTMADMGMEHDMAGMPGHNMGGTPPPAGQSGGGGGGHQGHGGTQTAPPANQHQGHQGMPGMGAVSTAAMAHGPDTHGPGNSMVPMMVKNRLGEPGTGLESAGHKVLVYTDLMNVEPFFDQRPPTRDIELHLTGSMERFMWSINGKKFSEDPTPIPLKYGERVRLIMVNDTMMEHPMHLHGMWMILENGHGANQPRKHTIIVKPAERMSVLVTADAVGPWAYHCHQLFHMEVGMFRVFEVRP